MTIATTETNTLALAEDQSWWTERQIAGLRQVGIDQATDGDLLVFFHVCQRTGLDPFARQIHMVGRNAKDENDRWVKKWTIQTGIDGFRLIADRADRRDGTMREYEETLWADAEGNWTEVWTKATTPTAAKVTVIRNGKRFPATVLFREYVQTKRNGEPNSMWARMPANQLAKCAEAAALRKAYPQDLSGLYADEEMAQADSHHVTQEPKRGLGAVLSQGHESDEQAPTESPYLNTSSALARRMFALFGEIGLKEKPDRLAYVADVIGREVGGSAEMTDADAEAVIAAIERDLAQPFAPVDEPLDGELVAE